MDDEEAEVRERARVRLGTVLKDKYRLESVLGAGGMAVVYAATHRNQKRFAVKILHTELSMRGDIRQRFLREGYAANSLNHPGAVSILDDDLAEDGAAFLVMELLEGAPLEKVAEQFEHRLPVRCVLAIAYQLLDVIAVAHAKAVVHRDIKPANLFLLGDGTLKVLDFGIARIRDATGSGPSATSTGAMLGTPAFMAPEQAGGLSSAVDGLTDVWAVGATMFNLLSGQFVHVAETATQMAIQAATQRARTLASVSADSPALLVELVDRALAFAREDRWPSATAMREALVTVHASLFAGPVSKAVLAELMDEYQSLSGAHSREALAPTMAAPSNPVITPGPAMRGPSIPDAREAVSGATPAPVLSPSASTMVGRRGPRWGRVAASLAGGVAALAAIALLTARTHTVAPAEARAAAVAPPVATSTAEPPPAAAPTPPGPTPAPAAPSPRLAVSPPNAAVEVDGKPVPVRGGLVEIAGAQGSMHMVHVVAGKRDGTYPVLLTETGPVPALVDLSSATQGQQSRAGPAPSARPSASPTAPPPRASGDVVSRTLE